MHGITSVRYFHKTHIGWENVVRWEVDGDAGLIESTDGTTIRFAPSLLAYGRDIKEILAEYIERARTKRAKEFPNADTQTAPVSEQTQLSRTAIVTDPPEVATLHQR
jgi:hypothetical protein